MSRCDAADGHPVGENSAGLLAKHTLFLSYSADNDEITGTAADPIRPLVDHVFGFEQLSEAFKRLKAGPMGKVLLPVP
jgi:hypothetical protein